MRGFSTGKLGEPLLNPSYLNLSRDKAPGWGMNGPGVSAEWTQGGESEWNSAAASADETNATIYQDFEVPRSGQYVLWVRYADWANKNENFIAQVTQNGRTASHEFGTKDIIDSHDEVSMYWGWAFTWDSTPFTLDKGPVRVSFQINKPAAARRHIDCFVLTNDGNYKPNGRQKPDFAASRYMREWSATRRPLTPWITNNNTLVSDLWLRPKVAGRDFLMPWNIAKEFWPMSDKPPAERPLYPFNAEPIDQFVATYKGASDVPIFRSKLVAPVIYINDLPHLLKEGSPFLKYIRETKSPFAVLINYGGAQFSDAEAHLAWNLLNGELKDQFLGWISGESVGYVWDFAPAELKITSSMSRRELLEAHRQFYSSAISRKWRDMFHMETGAMWDRLIPAQSTSSTSFAHALSEWGVNLLGIETAAVQPITGMRIAFTRGAARQFGGSFLYYHAPNFGDTATTFTKTQNFAGPDFFFHSRYGPTMGPSLSWYRKSYFLYYMAGASAIYLEQGFDQFFKPGPGEYPLQLNPLGRITDEFMRFAEKHPDRGTPYTPVAFLLDPAHGFDMTDYPQWPFEVSQINKSDRALRELFGVAYYPGLVVEGEPAIADRQPFVNGVFGDVFDVLTASESSRRSSLISSPLSAYRVVVVGGRVEWSTKWVQRLGDYVREGGTVVLNAQQVKGLPSDLLGVRLMNATAEANDARCLTQGDNADDLSGQVFRYEKIELQRATALMTTSAGDPLVTINKVGKGALIFCAVLDLLGEDERMTPLAAHMLAHVFSDATPIKVTGDVEYLINRSNNAWVITLLNNNGVLKSQQGMSQVDRNAYVTAKINFGSQPIESANEWIGEKQLRIESANGVKSVSVQIAPGGVAIVELRN
ncbi:MAG: hypothetical protein C5B55_10970 [Blastocatellia bacterium]|nr:MAG: hypothetical protein C5B55_10970 [Blastocatellia bacterium]